MKALIRHENETVTEDMNMPGIDWNTGMPLTNPDWAGGPYNLVQNYTPPQENIPESYEEIVDEPDQVVIEDEDDYVVIDGKKYSKAELRSLIE